MQFRKIFLASAILCSPNTALAQPIPTEEQLAWMKSHAPDGIDIYPDGIWVTAGRNENGARYGILLNDVMGAKPWGATVWMLGDHKADKSVTYRSEKFRVIMYCQSKTYKVGTSVRCGASGSVVWQRQGTPFDADQDVIPGTMAEHWMRIICWNTEGN